MADVVSYPITIPDRFVVYRDAPCNVTLQMQDSNDALVDLTLFGSAWAAQARTRIGAAAAVDFTVDDSAAASGTLVLSLTAAETTALNGGGTAYGFDVWATGATETPFPVWVGGFVTAGSYTDPAA